VSFKQLLEVEHSLQYQTASITKRGLLCDQEETNRQAAILDTGIAAATGRLDAAGIPANVATNDGRDSLEAYLKANGAKPSYSAKAELLSVGADDLRLAVMEAGEAAQAVVNDLVFVRQAEKVKAAYLQAFLLAAEADGRVHPTIKTMAARTHRMSISQPALQQIPAHLMDVKLSANDWLSIQDLLTHDELNREDFTVSLDTRGCLTADPGYLLVTADLAQVEQRVMATLACETKMIEAIKAGLDIHNAVARDMYQVPIEDVTHDERELAKRAGYLMIYGGGARRLALTANIPVKRAKETISLFRNTYQAIADYSKRLQLNDIIITPFGRELPIDPGRKYAATNYMIQSTARDLFVTGMMRLVKAGYGPYMWLPIHDEIVVNVPEDKAEQAAKDMSEALSISFYGTPIDAEGVVLGKRWRKA
jgi:DNA polymerase I-like protein with 3'-5' exonuclease and polymerase domains